MKIAKRLLAILIATVLLAVQGTALANEVVTYLHTDPLGSPIAATNAQGGVLWYEIYEPFGKRLRGADTDQTAVAYTGKPLDAESGLVYLGARYYDPGVGRFLSVDPNGFVVSQPNTFNRYAYANNSPYRYVDPNGHSALTWNAAEAGAEFGGEVGTVACGPLCGAVGAAVGGAGAGGTEWWAEHKVVHWAINEAKGDSGGGDAEAAPDATDSAKDSKRYSDEKKALVDMAKKDKKTGITADDMQSYKDLNKELSDPFPSDKVRGPESHPNRPHGKNPHGHVGPVDHIPIKRIN